MGKILTHNLGYPRVGAHRELKAACEAYWKGDLPLAKLEGTARELRAANWRTQKEAGIDLPPSNDFSFYDHILDTACLVGAVPERFGKIGETVDLPTYFKMARGESGKPDSDCGCGHAHPVAYALEMTKWFDTNYHYLVPEFGPATAFRLASSKPLDHYNEARALGIQTKPVLVGPVTFLALGKAPEGFDRWSLLDELLPVYVEVLRRLVAAGAEWIQFDEPVAVLDLDDAARAALEKAYTRFAAEVPSAKILVASYFGALRDNLGLFLGLPASGYHLDLTRGETGELAQALAFLPERKVLSLGVVDGRNVWRNDFAHSLVPLRAALEHTGPGRLWVAPGCSLLHAPVSLRPETKLDPELKSWLSFAEEKLAEVRILADALEGGADPGALASNAAAQESRRASPRLRNPRVRARVDAIKPDDLERRSAFPLRQKAQRERLKLPLFPTTTIGSFPQTAEVRAARAKWKKGGLTDAAYDAFLREETARTIRIQEEIGLDVLVHGEFERNDMVEYFGERMEGYAFTANGWVQSYGSRCVKPPLIYGDVARPKPMTVEWSSYAQSVTEKPMKGMLTGPITMLQWSFVRDDQPRRDTATQLALALRDEVLDLEAAGLPAIQIDEPALREGLPLRKADRAGYLKWSVDLFRLSAAGVRDDTQIHTHMCYCEFNDIVADIARLDADVISLEASRSRMELLGAFAEFQYPNEVGPGVWDIHSPRVPSEAEMEELLRKALKVVPRENLWANPDCGLKTRGWAEVEPALRNLVAAAKALRAGI